MIRNERYTTAESDEVKLSAPTPPKPGCNTFATGIARLQIPIERLLVFVMVSVSSWWLGSGIMKTGPQCAIAQVR